jgi:hypothetical protein
MFNNYGMRLKAIGVALINQQSHLEKLVEVQCVPKPMYRIVLQTLQFTKWDEWTREEQIKNSYGTDKETAKSGKVCISGYCFLLLKEE